MNFDFATVPQSFTCTTVGLVHWKFALNDKKCAAMLLRSRLKKIKLARILFGTSELAPVKDVKYLGVILDQHLRWDKSGKKVRRSVDFARVSVNRVKGGLPMNARVYRSLVQPHFDLQGPIA